MILNDGTQEESRVTIVETADTSRLHTPVTRRTDATANTDL